MVLYKRSNSKRNILATYGVAMSSLFVATDMNADILDITWNNGLSTVSFTVFGSGTVAAQPANVDQLGTETDFDVFYTQFTNGPYGSKMFSSRNFEVANSSVTGVTQVMAGQVLNHSSFKSLTKLSFDISGSGYVGFRTVNGNVGWFKIDLAGGLAFSVGEFGSEGESLMVGEIMGDVNCDGLLDLLDVQPFVDLLTSGGFSVKADFDGDKAVTLLDVDPFVDVLIGN